MGCFKAGKPVGVGARWPEDRATAWRLQDGKKEGEISLKEAAAIAKKVGLRPPGQSSACAIS